eukprot:TRINITY_DN586_c0_g2_i1.p1 TRINITY_DN586_c0_g2~~TRINITY_DN586_c0_g2_i1.p1  ORF type:complete len:356 (+),score=62.44 TRINITY_DN586_c0_g2_i1:638-1705(+)
MDFDQEIFNETEHIATTPIPFDKNQLHNVCSPEPEYSIECTPPTTPEIPIHDHVNKNIVSPVPQYSQSSPGAVVDPRMASPSFGYMYPCNQAAPNYYPMNQEMYQYYMNQAAAYYGNMFSMPAMNPEMYMQMAYSQMLNQQYMAQMAQVYTSSTTNSRKRKAPARKPSRRVRPKVNKDKGAIQCQGRNRKKNTRCRNAALMEYIGPRPLYCAEHITLDKDCLYTKCCSKYQKEVGDGKGCREVVLKEFGLCHKHFHDMVCDMNGLEGYKTALKYYTRVSELISNLEEEAKKAKKTDADLYQRKNKLLPKFHSMKNTLEEHLKEFHNPSSDNFNSEDVLSSVRSQFKLKGKIVSYL